MKIVVLDGFTANPGDLSWEGLEALGSCVVYERTPPDLTVKRAQGAEIVLTNKTVLDQQTIAALTQLRYIGVLATGYNVVDLVAAREGGITVTNIPGYSTASVAQMVLALILELAQQVGHHSTLVHQGRWSRSPDFSFWDRPLVELEGLTLGIVGFGAIGQAVARLAQAFGMQILVTTRTPEKYRSQVDPEVRFVDNDELFRCSDIVSLHCPLTAETTNLVDERRLAMMKASAWLINTGRGALVNEAALAAALNTGRIGGAGLDVLCQEPPAADHPLFGAKNCFITPHIAWATQAARQRLVATAVANVAAFLAGKAQNVVS